MANTMQPDNVKIETLETFLGKSDYYSNKELLEALYTSTQILKDLEIKTRETETVKKVISLVLDEVSVRFDLYSTFGFFQAYYEMLPEFETSLDTFTALNDIFEAKTGEKRFNDFGAFKNALGMN